MIFPFVSLAPSNPPSIPKAFAKLYDAPRRGAWLRAGATLAGDAVLFRNGGVASIVVGPDEASPVRRAAEFLAGDVQKLTGRRPAVVVRRPDSGVVVELKTSTSDRRWEAYSVQIDANGVTITGSNPRGTAFGSYALSEGIGIDPLHQWTRYEPKRVSRLAVKPGSYDSNGPTFRFRGLFHDDEDILPRPLDPRHGYPFVRGRVPDEWYDRFFETALRLRMNMVAPYTRVKRDFAVQKRASDWGLFYTSHHYDILLSNPYGFTNFGLAKQRGVEGKYDWYSNKAGFLKYWKGGLDENKDLDAIWPVGLRGTDDAPYTFPTGTTDEEKARVWDEVIRAQVAMVSQVVPAEKRHFHFTLYHEMLNAFKQGKFDVPKDATIVWDDNGDGLMRGLPTDISEERRKRHRHGVYYHLAFFGANAKQSVHTVTPARVVQEWRKIVDSGATEFALTNVSELREHVMETRLIADILWDAPSALTGSDPASEFETWWANEYFGTPTAKLAYDDYHRVVSAADDIYIGSAAVAELMDSILKRFTGIPYEMPPAERVADWERRRLDAKDSIERAERFAATLTPERRAFFREHAILGMRLLGDPLEATVHLRRALEAKTDEEAKRHVEAAYGPLERLERAIRDAERAPFQSWYRPTWIRSRDFHNGWSNMYPRRPIEQVRLFMQGMGWTKGEPDAWGRPR